MVLTTSTADERHPGHPPRRVQRVGYLQGPVPAGMDCERPVRFLVSRYGGQWQPENWNCRSSRASFCRPCSARYGRRVETLAAFGLVGRDRGFHYLLTLTPPGDEQHCKKKDCSRLDCVHEKCVCTPLGGIDLADWNPTCSKKWNRFLILFERRFGFRPDYFRAVECQDGKRTVDGCGRMGLHLHVLLRSECKISVQNMRNLALRTGFGHEVDLKEIAPGSRAAARYVAKYVTKSCDDRDDVPWRKIELVDLVDDDGEIVFDPETGEIPQVPSESNRATFRTWSQSRSWGVRMKVLVGEAKSRWVSREEERQRQSEVVTVSAREDPPPD